MYDIIYYLVYHNENKTYRKLGCPYDWNVITKIDEKILGISFNKQELESYLEEIEDKTGKYEIEE